MNENEMEFRYKEFLSAAHAYYGKNIDSFFKSKGYKFPELKWLQRSLLYPAFQHMAFSFHNNVYSIQFAFVMNGEILIPKWNLENQLNECKANNLIPCLFPVQVKTFAPIFPGCNLISSESYDTVELSPGIENTPMSAWELSNLAVDGVCQDIEKKGCRIEGISDLPSMEPNLWFTDKKGNRSYVIVKAISGNTKENVSYKPNAQIMEKMKEYKGYFAEVFFVPCESVTLSSLFDKKTPIEILRVLSKVALNRLGLYKHPIVTDIFEPNELIALNRGVDISVDYTGLKDLEELAKERGVETSERYFFET